MSPAKWPVFINGIQCVNDAQVERATRAALRLPAMSVEEVGTVLRASLGQRYPEEMERP